MSFDDNMRELFVKLLSDLDGAEFTVLYELYSYCYGQCKLYSEAPEKEIEILCFDQIAKYFDLDNEHLRRILKTDVFSGAGLVSGLKAGNIQAHYIYQLYRLFTEVDRKVLSGVLKNNDDDRALFEKLQDKLISLNASQRDPLEERELRDHYWHSVMTYGFIEGAVSRARKESFGKCYSQFLEVFRESGGDIAAIRSFVDGIAEN